MDILNMLNGLDVFSGIGGISLALKQWVRPIAYCEIDPYCRGVLLSRFADGSLPYAPIWDDIRSLDGRQLPKIDIIYGGFPCQDISFAGKGIGLGGERSGLVFEVFRLIDETKPSFVFLENVAAIRTRGAERVVKELAARGYDCRWDTLSAFDVGAPHKRDRWWLLGYAHGKGESVVSVDGEASGLCSDAATLADSNRSTRGNERQALEPHDSEIRFRGETLSRYAGDFGGWETESAICRVVDGLSNRSHRLRALGNAVVPAQAREAFKRLMGIY